MSASVPVVRAADESKPGSGTIRIEESDPLRVLGHETQFTSQCKVKGQLVLPKSVGYAQASIAKVISDTELKLARVFKATPVGSQDEVDATEDILDELNDTEKDGAKGLKYKVLPHIDQHDLYGHVYECMNNSGTMGIFPEGGSHDQPGLLPLKAGVAVMALGAMSKNSNLKIKIVPVGLSYFHPNKFRSRAVVEFGAPIDVPRDLVEKFEQGGSIKREASGKLLDTIHEGLKTVTIRAPDYDTLIVG